MVPHTDAFLAGLLDAAPDAIVAADESGLILLINAQAERLFGYDRDDLVGKSIELLVPESLRDSHSSYRTGYARNPRPRPMGSGLDLAGRRKDGTTFPAEISLSSFRAGGSTIFAAAVRDATGRRRAESKFRGLLEGAPDAMVESTVRASSNWPTRRPKPSSDTRAPS
jgi:PAS domain S-box-containing protein